ncbi:anti-sigma regulatory factor (Ser/Thr protein kinase) [Actinomycetospora succinea]|uniref:Anti-sigma regulatory factor (Ser/Thr protein kinase) n=1 Tax=Actinomycetospora succinea TaxID=663603 RepID=A0A4R6VRG0_9PSEU|nr:ATP-binding protein [Actinomycetospora succinea]TDQ65144.1 anti-sigma regulatory factor (Ser/Thr protein kinase) [Actinomycetospora succinea]
MPTTDSRGAATVPRWPEPLRITATAHGAQVRVLRRYLTQWLDGDHLDADVIDDLVLATSEALENCCDHAYAGTSVSGVMTLAARPFDHGLVITVGDDGHWQPTSAPGTRGRGLAMMRTLVDDVAVHAGADGTHIALTLYGAGD